MRNIKPRDTESLVSQLAANALLNNFDYRNAVELVIAMEKQAASMDFTTPLYQYFKSVMEREDPNGL